MKLADRPTPSLPFPTDGAVYWNLSSPELVEHAVRRREGALAEGGPLVTITAPHTGRSPNDKFVVREEQTESEIWWGEVNRPMAPAHFEALRDHAFRHARTRDLYVQDLHLGADPRYRLPIRVITEYAWHSLFARNLFLRIEDPAAAALHDPQFTVVSLPSCQADPLRHGTRSETFIVLNFAQRIVLIGGTSYAGEIKKSMFTVMNYLLPRQGIPSMHCSANVGADGRSALFFGLSGTGKTTLSTDPHRPLVGDDEHGWTDEGIFNFEGGCYAKVIRLSPEAEPEIYATTRMFGTILENVVMDPSTRTLDLDDATITENTRGAYPITHLSNYVPGGRAGHPSDVVLLTADAFGVLPPIARLTPEQVMYHFLSGYTAKVAGTERGVTDPEATFSACFGAPFLPLAPGRYAELLAGRIRAHRVRAWLVNTGWTGGPFGVGRRIGIQHTRALLRAALTGDLDDVPYRSDPVFGLHVPERVPGVPQEILLPRATWSDGDAYDAQARRLARMFTENFRRFASQVSQEIRDAGPRV
ncbi:MAG: phosphoenolpyruvate carboxykinase [Armatimonadota bacterium]|nr:phosphoenolpyruvate carboxykinase [Armatimonadota bacterium]MDR5696456.1 phosphoenolpyruvate carboxykinase [Armatimonadota bacterium]